MARPDPASRPTDWSSVGRALAARRADLDGDDLDRLADALFWTDRVDDSIEVRRDAYQAHAAVADDASAARSAWRLFYDHFLVGENAVAAGWLERCRRHVEDAPDSAEAGWLAVAESDLAMAGGDHAAGADSAERARSAARRTGDDDLEAMALQALGRARILLGDRREGLGLLDEAMVAVINEELTPLYTGWVYCNVISTCYGLADVRRAAEWSDAAMKWCATLRDGLMYPGLCRVYSAELTWLRGSLVDAEAAARRAAAELDAFDPRYAGDAHYLVGELSRLQGRTTEAEAAFRRADELGRDPQPGRACLWAADGRSDEAIRVLQARLRDGGDGPMARARTLLVAALLRFEHGGDEPVGWLRAAGEGLPADGGPVIDTHRLAVDGLVRSCEGDTIEAADLVRRAVAGFRELGMPYEVGRLRRVAGRLATLAGDQTNAALELEAAIDGFERIGATADAARARTELAAVERSRSGRDRSETGQPDRSSEDDRFKLTARETEVLGLVADGLSNREIGDRLHLSRHTVARHVANLLTKMGVSSRTEATAVAYESGLLGRRADAER